MTEEKAARAKEKIEKSVLERVDHLNEMRKGKEKVVSHNQLNLKNIEEAEKHALLKNIKIKDQKVFYEEDLYERLIHISQIESLLGIKHQQVEKSKKKALITANLRRDIQKTLLP